MTATPAIPVPEPEAPWTCSAPRRSETGLSLVMDRPGLDPIPVRLQRCADSRLALAYPVTAHDIDVLVEAALPPRVRTALLGALGPAILRADPGCRRIVVAVAADDHEALAAVVDAGLRPTVEVDLPEGEFVLTVAEPTWVTAVDIDLDHVPGT
ncbi:hypothetical protein [Nocardia niwae]|uniref:hypothetical protein n=1 Tax=Nocardia niwae TaxID=626084 RepID=UPI000A60C81C|nr:hypothetical protein [Nocardia niwae]